MFIVKPFNLQLFAEESASDLTPDEPENAPKSSEEEKGEKTFTQAELDKIVKDRLKRAEKENQKKIEEARTEAQKLAKMNEEQKKAYEQEKIQMENENLKNQIAQLEKQAQRTELSKSAATILQENHKITATQDILDFVVGETAEDTNVRIEKLVSVIKADRKAVEAERALGRTPKIYRTDHEKPSPFEAKLNKYKR
ncbi:capsid assembly scaffolding protein Gp46 family protein [Dubosiella newyorkensis]|uniref:capsid assembly scaffolding protein Gp46 family protein n=1 Tax=Dubosiella newyorkensis TaxID=1862672 RepID=UPI0023526CB3|nr:DUF4355 domain-containing protein [Dubosiella newyorkensis]MCI9042262.1 DUF4355 domain-containing protein [Dubosiella newyorkensis]